MPKKKAKIIPEEYRAGVWKSVQGGSYPLDASRGTYSTWKLRYIKEVALKMGYL